MTKRRQASKFRKQVGRIENMEYDPVEDCFTCALSRKLYLRRETSKVRNGQPVSTAWYRCEDCRGCPRRAQCCRAKVPNKPKEIILKKTFWEKREQGQFLRPTCPQK